MCVFVCVHYGDGMENSGSDRPVSRGGCKAEAVRARTLLFWQICLTFLCFSDL